MGSLSSRSYLDLSCLEKAILITTRFVLVPQSSLLRFETTAPPSRLLDIFITLAKPVGHTLVSCL